MTHQQFSFPSGHTYVLSDDGSQGIMARLARHNFWFDIRLMHNLWDLNYVPCE